MYENLRHILNKEKITIKELAEFLGVTEKTMHNKLNGKTPFTYPETQKVRKFLLPQYNPDYLFATSDKTS